MEMGIKFDKKKIQRLLKKQEIDPDIPITNIDAELNEIQKLLESSNSKIVKNHLKRYIVIRIVTILESFFKDLVVDLIDDFNSKYDDLFGESIVSLPLSSLDDIHGKKITKGQIISASLNLQKISDIDEVFSTLIVPNFLKTLKSYKISKPSNSFTQNWDKFSHIFDLRHDVVHNYETIVNYSNKQMREIIDSADIFSMLSLIVIFHYVYQKNPKKLKSKYPIIHGWFYPDKQHIVT